MEIFYFLIIMILKFDLINYIVNYINKNFKNKYNFTYHNQKYNLNELINAIINITKTGCSYRDYQFIDSWINYKSLHRHMKFFAENNIFQNIYKQLLGKYFKTNKTNKLKYQLVDTTFIYNQYGVTNIGRNKYYKNKKGYKLSCLTDVNGIPISILLDSGNTYDGHFIEKHFNAMLIETNTNKYKEHNRYKQYIMADSMYDANKIRKVTQDKGYVTIIDYNKRNSKNPKELTTFEKSKYKKRIKIENCFSWLKKNKRVKDLYDKSPVTYMGYVYLAFCTILFTRLC
jgi:transposase